MKSTPRLWLVAASVIAVAATGLLAQTPTAPPFEPQPGMPGKDVVWVPTPDALVDKMLELTKVTAKDVVLDLGSGDGRTVIAAAKRGATAQGIEYNPQMVELSRRNAAAAGVGAKGTFTQADLFQTDLSKATVITMFLLPQINMQLRPKILDLKPGTRIASNTFTMEDWEADETATIPDCERWCTALLWIVPAKVEGKWRSADGVLTLAQRFQILSGTLGAGSAVTPIAGRLHGADISFTAGTAQYAGRVTGNSIAGTVTTGGSTRNWRATRVP